MEATRARPVPFCFHSFLPEPETSLRFLVACVPWRMRGAVMLHRFPEQGLVHLAAEDLIGQLQGSDFVSAEIDNVNVCHRFLFVRTGLDLLCALSPTPT